jgi:hypothetical protein
MIGNMIAFIGSRVSTAFDSVTTALGDHRSLLCWIYAAFYLVLVCWCVLNNRDTMNTAIMVTGGVISTIFASYVAGSAYQAVNTAPQTSTEEEASAGD